MSEGGFDDRATHMTCGTEDLRIGLSGDIGIRRSCIGTGTTHDPYSLLGGVVRAGWVAAQGELEFRTERC